MAGTVAVGETAVVAKIAAVALAAAPPVEGTAVGDASAVTLAGTAPFEEAAVAVTAAVALAAAPPVEGTAMGDAVAVTWLILLLLRRLPWLKLLLLIWLLLLLLRALLWATLLLLPCLLCFCCCSF